MKFFLFIVVIIGAAFGVIAFQNNTEVSLTFIKWDFTDHIAIVLASPFAAGLLAGIALLLPTVWKKSSQARHSKKQMQELEERLKSTEEDPESGNEERDEAHGDEENMEDVSDQEEETRL